MLLFFLHTYWSSHHVIHEGSQTPPVYSSIVTWPGQDLWSPERVKKISQEVTISGWKTTPDSGRLIKECTLPYMYSMVPQKVCVTAPSWIDSLQRPKSVNLMCPEKKKQRKYFLKKNIAVHIFTFFIWVKSDSYAACVTLMIKHDVFRF